MEYVICASATAFPPTREMSGKSVDTCGQNGLPSYFSGAGETEMNEDDLIIYVGAAILGKI